MININRFKTVGIISIIVGLILYFIYHAISGDSGILAFIHWKNQHDKIKEKYEDLKSERLQLEHKVNLLRSKSLDLDLLEEQAKKVLSYAKDNEEIYYNSNNKDDKLDK
jgi:cell division protein FtsB